MYEPEYHDSNAVIEALTAAIYKHEPALFIQPEGSQQALAYDGGNALYSISHGSATLSEVYAAAVLADAVGRDSASAVLGYLSDPSRVSRLTGGLDVQVWDATKERADGFDGLEAFLGETGHSWSWEIDPTFPEIEHSYIVCNQARFQEQQKAPELAPLPYDPASYDGATVLDRLASYLEDQDWNIDVDPDDGSYELQAYSDLGEDFCLSGRFDPAGSPDEQAYGICYGLREAAADFDPDEHASEIFNADLIGVPDDLGALIKDARSMQESLQVLSDSTWNFQNAEHLSAPRSNDGEERW